MSERPALSILLVDDEPEVAAVMAAWLRRAGHPVVVAGSGRHAAAVLQSVWVDVVVTDVLMADGDGIELLGALRQRLPRPRLIAMSGGGRYVKSEDCLEIARGYGADVALAKPFTIEQLLAAVQGMATVAT
jgi:two-component system chemotaxis response regulator CheY